MLIFLYTAAFFAAPSGAAPPADHCPGEDVADACESFMQVGVLPGLGDRQHGGHPLEPGQAQADLTDLPRLSAVPGLGDRQQGEHLLEPGQAQANLTDLPRLSALAPNAGPVVDTCEKVTNIKEHAENFLGNAEVCPQQCQYAVQTAFSKCQFLCVEKDDCGKFGETTETVPDKTQHVCRACQVIGCDQCDDSAEDKCSVCKPGFKLENGQCGSFWKNAWMILAAVALSVVLLVLCWLGSLIRAPIVNPAGLEEGLAFRYHTLLMQPLEKAGDTPRIYPLNTNLAAGVVGSEPAGGCAMMLHFRFQIAVLCWAVVMLVSWALFAYGTDAELLTLGTMPWDNAINLCAVIFYGFKRQHELIPTRLWYFFAAYVFTTLGALLHSFRNQYMYSKIDSDCTSSRDFCGWLSGLPNFKGTEKPEEQLKAFLQEQSGEHVIGVSVFWNYSEDAEAVAEAAEGLLGLREKPYLKKHPLKEQQIPEDFVPRHGLFGAVDALLGFDDSSPPEETPFHEEKTTLLLQKMESSSSAVVVFESELSQTRAVERLSKGMIFRGKQVTIEQTEVEPESVDFEAFGSQPFKFVWRIALAMCVVFGMVLIWVYAVLFPFEALQVSAGGQSVGLQMDLAFTLIVILGNQVLYNTCDIVSSSCSFSVKTHTQALYTFLYFSAVILTVCVDLYTTIVLAKLDLVHRGARNHAGILVEQMTDTFELFDSYPIQKKLGQGLYDYCVPATFILGFLIEPVALMAAPKLIFTLLVRTHPHIRGPAAEKALAFLVPLDLGRYGDILVNVVLAVLVMFFPPAQFAPLFIALIVGHMWILGYDHYRTLRGVEAFNFATDTVDKVANRLLVIPCALIAICIGLKLNCNVPDDHGNPMFMCLHQDELWWTLGTVFMAHVVIHMFFLDVIIPRLLPDHIPGDDAYADYAEKTPATWFSLNKVHCLRSHLIYKHSPPCYPFYHGKSHLLQENKAIGCYFKGHSDYA